MPSRKQERLEHRQRRPRLLALGGRIKRGQNLVGLRPIDQRRKRVEARLALGFCRKLKGLVPIRRSAMSPSKPRWAKWNHGAHAAATARKHLRAGLLKPLTQNT